MNARPGDRFGHRAEARRRTVIRWWVEPTRRGVPAALRPARRSVRDRRTRRIRCRGARWAIDLTKPFRSPAIRDGRHPRETIDLTNGAPRRKLPHLDEHRPGHRDGDRRAAHNLTHLDEDHADETAVEATEGGPVTVGDPLDEVVRGFWAGDDIDRGNRHPMLLVVRLRLGHHQGPGRPFRPTLRHRAGHRRWSSAGADDRRGSGAQAARDLPPGSSRAVPVRPAVPGCRAAHWVHGAGPVTVPGRDENLEAAGNDACCTQCWLTEPSSIPAKAPCPRLPTTSNCAPSAASSST